ncbi:hypothetical protein EJB05_52503, partial [Eragrostis curvula]
MAEGATEFLSTRHRSRDASFPEVTSDLDASTLDRKRYSLIEFPISGSNSSFMRHSDPRGVAGSKRRISLAWIDIVIMTLHPESPHADQEMRQGRGEADVFVNLEDELAVTLGFRGKCPFRNPHLDVLFRPCERATVRVALDGEGDIGDVLAVAGRKLCPQRRPGHVRSVDEDATGKTQIDLGVKVPPGLLVWMELTTLNCTAPPPARRCKEADHEQQHGRRRRRRHRDLHGSSPRLIC